VDDHDRALWPYRMGRRPTACRMRCDRCGVLMLVEAIPWEDNLRAQMACVNCSARVEGRILANHRGDPLVNNLTDSDTEDES
jgi:hypothetical protein